MSEFFGELITMDLPDGRTKVVLFDFGFADRAGYVWPCFRGDVIDGASIPRAFWSIFGSPYCGKYRRAAALHDSGYMYQIRSQRACDNMLSAAALVDGCRPRTAWALDRAVRNFGGPAWRDMDQGDRNLSCIPRAIACIPPNMLIPEKYVSAMDVLRAETEATWNRLSAPTILF